MVPFPEDRDKHANILSGPPVALSSPCPRFPARLEVLCYIWVKPGDVIRCPCHWRAAARAGVSSFVTAALHGDGMCSQGSPGDGVYKGAATWVLVQVNGHFCWPPCACSGSAWPLLCLSQGRGWSWAGFCVQMICCASRHLDLPDCCGNVVSLRGIFGFPRCCCCLLVVATQPVCLSLSHCCFFLFLFFFFFPGKFFEALVLPDLASPGSFFLNITKPTPSWPAVCHGLGCTAGKCSSAECDDGFKKARKGKKIPSGILSGNLAVRQCKC